MESATTNLSEVTADFVRLWDGAALQHKDVRELFLHKQSVVAPESVELQVGQETDTELVYPAPTNEQVPGLRGLLEYIDARGTGGVVNKHVSLKRKHFTLNEGSVHQVQQQVTRATHKHEQLCVVEHHTQQKHSSHHHTHKHQLNTESHHSYQKIVKKTNLIILEVFAPVMLVRQIRNTRVTRPTYIFEP
jgi:hypothetical protein